ncbi:hypothetical protein Tco_0503914 [Tanacetum coccineum]
MFKNLVILEENLKENISSGTLLVFREPSILLPPAEPPNEFLKNAVLNFPKSKKTFPLNVEDVNSFAFIIWSFLPFFTYNKEFPFTHADGSNFKVNCHRLKHYYGGDTPPLVIQDLQTFPKDN